MFNSVKTIYIIVGDALLNSAAAQFNFPSDICQKRHSEANTLHKKKVSIANRSNKQYGFDRRNTMVSY